MRNCLRISPLFLFLAACSAGGTIMTMNAFYDIPVGATKEEVITAAGEPFAIHRREDGSLEYEYIERFQAGSRSINERHYFILIKDCKVASKRVKQSSPSPYTFDSYEMQTSEASSSEPPDVP